MSEQYKTVSSRDSLLDQPSDTGVIRQRIAGQLAGAVAHDLNNMLATILGCLELMERRIEEPDRLTALIKRSSDAVERAANLTSRLAQFARRQPQPNVSTEINALISDLMPLIASALGRRIRVSAEPSPTPAFIQVDPTGLEATLLALCLAARAAIPESGFVAFTTQISGSQPTISLTATCPNLSQLELAQSRRIASAVGLVIQADQITNKADVTVVVSPASHNVSSGGAIPTLVSSLDSRNAN